MYDQPKRGKLKTSTRKKLVAGLISGIVVLVIIGALNAIDVL